MKLSDWKREKVEIVGKRTMKLSDWKREKDETVGVSIKKILY